MLKRISVALCFLFFQISYSHAQKKLSVGDLAPEISVFKWIKGEPVSGFKKDNIYIIEFGATWCKPCGLLIPKLAALSQKYDSNAVVASFFVMEENNNRMSSDGEPNYVSNVRKYVKKNEAMINYSVAVDTKEKDMELKWLTAADKIGLPYIFLIDKNGAIAWIGAGSDFNDLEQEIVRVLSPEYTIDNAVLRNLQKHEKDTPYDPKKLLLIDGNGGHSEDFLFRSVLTKYKGDIKNPPIDYVLSFLWVDSTSEWASYKGRIQTTGTSLSELYQIAYGDTVWNQTPFRSGRGQFPDTIKPGNRTVYGWSWFEPLVEVKDKRPFVWSYRSNENKYNYSLKVSNRNSSAKFLQEAMQHDLKTYFGYDVTIEQRLMPAWKLRATDQAKDLLKSKTPGLAYNRETSNDVYYYTNATTRDIISKLGIFFGFGMFDYGRLPKDSIGPFIDETHINYEIDFQISPTEREDINKFNQYLKTIGLYLVKELKPMKVVIIKDAVKN